jgi:amino-acid N-acetyltransferase
LLRLCPRHQTGDSRLTNVLTPPISIRRATAADAESVRALLNAADLPLVGVPADLGDFLVAEREGGVVGAIGLERYGSAALLRSAVVHPAHRGERLGERLVTALLRDARGDGVREIVLLTTTAERWFPRFGFKPIERSAVPAALEASAEFQGACPDTAIIMRLALS